MINMEDLSMKLSDKDLEKVAEAVSFARAYVMKFSKDNREIDSKDIPEWIKIIIDEKLGESFND